MLKSMTGFGRAEQTVNDKTYLVEIKSLNGKQLEINLKIPPLLKSFEFDVRSLLQENLLRGTVECFFRSATPHEHKQFFEQKLFALEILILVGQQGGDAER